MAEVAHFRQSSDLSGYHSARCSETRESPASESTIHDMATGRINSGAAVEANAAVVVAAFAEASMTGFAAAPNDAGV